ncbi:enolase C-terminal domain-like protein, partial [Candidatus Latescibacterota bacterium]
HIAACTPNCVIMENYFRLGQGEQWIRDMFYGDDITITRGYAALPDKPGLGCDLDEKVAAKYPYRSTKISDTPYTGNTYEDGAPKDH